MKEKLLDNLSLKVLSIVVAIIFWVIIVNVYDPSTSVTVSGVNVELLNTDALTSKDYSYEIVDGSKISVYISGPRSIVTDIKASDIVATADLSNVTVFSDYVDIDVRVNKDGIAASSLEVAPRTTAIKLKIENRVTKTFNIETQIVGTPAEGYMVGAHQISPATINVTGTVSMVDSVASAKVVYDVSGLTMDVSDTANVILYDHEGNEIHDDKLELSKNSVDIRISLLSVKTVPIRYNTKGTPAEGYAVSNIEYSLSEVTIAGTQEKLDAINEISVPDTSIDITGLDSDRTFYVYLATYLPEGVTIPSTGVVNVTVHMYQTKEKEIVIPVGGINVVGLAADKKVSFGDLTEVKVVLVGDENVLAALNAINIVPTITLTNMDAGEVQVPVTFTLPQKCVTKTKYMVDVIIQDSAIKTNEIVTTINKNINA